MSLPSSAWPRSSSPMRRSAAARLPVEVAAPASSRAAAKPSPRTPSTNDSTAKRTTSPRRPPRERRVDPSRVVRSAGCAGNLPAEAIVADFLSSGLLRSFDQVPNCPDSLQAFRNIIKRED